ncbi:unnamed protein product [Ixodes pacificus]
MVLLARYKIARFGPPYTRYTSPIIKMEMQGLHAPAQHVQCIYTHGCRRRTETLYTQGTDTHVSAGNGGFGKSQQVCSCTKRKQGLS